MQNGWRASSCCINFAVPRARQFRLVPGISEHPGRPPSPSPPEGPGMPRTRTRSWHTRRGRGSARGTEAWPEGRPRRKTQLLSKSFGRALGACHPGWDSAPQLAAAISAQFSVLGDELQAVKQQLGHLGRVPLNTWAWALQIYVPNLCSD